MSGLVTAIAGGVIAAGTSAYELSQSNSIAGQELGLAQTTESEQQYYNSMLQRLLADPSSVASLPGYQFELSQGSQAVVAGMGPSGLAGSGNEAAALTQFGQGLASSFYNQQVSLLSALSGVTNASSPSQAGSAATGASSLTTNTLSNLLNSLGFSGTLLSKLQSPGAGAASGTPAQLGAGGFGPGGEDTVYG